MGNDRLASAVGPIDYHQMTHTPPGRRSAFAATLSSMALLTAVLGCPIQRPPIPLDYYRFRDVLRDSVRSVAVVELSGRVAMQERLEEELPAFSTLTRPDSLLATLGADPILSPLAAPLERTVREVLESDVGSGAVRKAFRKPDGQRLAVDAILIGLGQALRQVRTSGGVGAGSWPLGGRDRPGGRQLAVTSGVPSSSASRLSPRLPRMRSTVSPILLLGVDAPAVRPIST